MKTKTGIVALIILSLALSSLALEEREKSAVFPGQSITLLGIQIKWIVPDKEKADSENLGSLEIIGPSQKKSIPFKEIFAGGEEGWNQFVSYLYIDEVVLEIMTNTNTGIKVDPAASEEYNLKPIKAAIIARFKESAPEIKNKPYNFEIYVSSLCPIYIDDWKISYSEDKIELADGSQYYMIYAEKQETKEKIDIPVMRRSYKNAGRFTIEILDNVDELTKTQRLGINVEPDMTIRGRDAYIDEFVFSIDPANPKTKTIEYFLETLADKYGLKIIWDEDPGHPESVKVMKNLPSGLGGSIRISNRNVADLIDDFLDKKGIIAKWETTPTYLHLYYQDYEKEIKKKEQEKEEAEKLKVKKEEFHKDYAIETKAYQFTTISAETAKSLISPELHTYYLYAGNSGFHIRSAPLGDNFNGVIETVQETAVADEKTNTLILSAIPKTHEKFQEIIQKIDAILKKSETPISVKPFKISLSLFLGTKTASLDENARTQKKQELLKQAEQYGINKDDIALLDFDTLEQIGRGFTPLYPEKGEVGKTLVSLGKGLSCTLEFLDLRQPYLIIRASLYPRIKTKDTTLLESTLYLVPEKPTTLGITDLQGAYILLLKMEKPE